MLGAVHFRTRVWLLSAASKGSWKSRTGVTEAGRTFININPQRPGRRHTEDTFIPKRSCEEAEGGAGATLQECFSSKHHGRMETPGWILQDHSNLHGCVCGFPCSRDCGQAAAINWKFSMICFHATIREQNMMLSLKLQKPKLGEAIIPSPFKIKSKSTDDGKLIRISIKIHFYWILVRFSSKNCSLEVLNSALKTCLNLF